MHFRSQRTRASRLLLVKTPEQSVLRMTQLMSRNRLLRLGILQPKHYRLSSQPPCFQSPIFLGILGLRRPSTRTKMKSYSLGQPRGRTSPSIGG
jgi:hypothetical protein